MHANGSLKKITFIVFFCLFVSSKVVFGADNTCGNSSCEETAICSAAGVFVCSDWNDGSYDSWTTSSNLDSKGGRHGDIRSGVGINGTKGWAHEIYPGEATTVFYGNTAIQGYTGPLYTRLYVRFSDNYIHGMGCGLQKQFYHKWLNDDGSTTRIMLGSTKARDIPKFSSEPSSVGLIGFDWVGHIVEGPDQSGDVAVAIQRNQWYSVEFMTDYNSAAGTVTVKVWIDGQLQMERIAAAADASWKAGYWTGVQDTSWMGGGDDCNKAPEQQQVFKDNVVISRNYIGPIDGIVARPNPPSQINIQQK